MYAIRSYYELLLAEHGNEVYVGSGRCKLGVIPNLATLSHNFLLCKNFRPVKDKNRVGYAGIDEMGINRITSYNVCYT